jgi:hypothetical protein
MLFPRADAAAVLERASAARDPRMRLAWLLASLMSAASVWIGWSRGDDVRRLPDDDRGALYAHTLESIRTFCTPSERLPTIAEPCRREAALVLQFPECDAVCRALAEPHRPHATR